MPETAGKAGVPPVKETETEATSPVPAPEQPSVHEPPAAVRSRNNSAPLPGTVPFGPGESLVYEVSYFAVVAGTARVDPIEMTQYKGKTVYRIRAVAETSKLFSYFFRVYDVIEVFMDAEKLHPLAMTVHIEQGTEKYDELYEYDQDRGEAVYTSGEKRKASPIPKGVQDSLSSLFYYRTLTHPLRETLSFEVYASQKVWGLEVTALKKERITTKRGDFIALLVRPVTRFEGVLQRRGELQMWFSDDERRIPLRLKVEVVFGSVIADLVSYAPGAPLPARSSLAR